MSTTDRQSLPTGVSRRSIIRTAAWAAPAVSIVVATPAFAATGDTATAVTLSSTRITTDKLLVWTISITNAGTKPLTGLTVTFSGVTDVVQLTVTTGATIWTGSGTTTRTYPDTLARGAAIQFVAEFVRTSNPSETATATFVAGAPSTQVAVTSGSY